MMRRLAIPILLLLFVFCQVAVWPGAVRAVELPPAGHFSLWQLPTQERVPWDNRLGQYVAMSYVIQGPTGRVAVIDGGWVGDAPYLKTFLQGLGGHVDDWFISHQHPDHVGALTSILQNPSGIQVDRIYASLLSDEWMGQYAPGNLATAQAFNTALLANGKSVIEPSLGEGIVLDSLTFKTLQLADESTNWTTNLNDQSMVLRLFTSGTSVLFLGDLYIPGGERLLAGECGDQLGSEYVQMAHHGNWGAGREVYEAVGASYALWPTPAFLWNAPMPNEDGFDCAIVRQWMVELGIEENYVMKDGLIRLDLPAHAPEPSTWTLLSAGSVAILLWVRWRRKMRKQSEVDHSSGSRRKNR